MSVGDVVDLLGAVGLLSLAGAVVLQQVLIRKLRRVLMAVCVAQVSTATVVETLADLTPGVEVRGVTETWPC